MQNDESEFGQFCRFVRQATGLDLSAYKRNQMERRARAYAQRTGAGSLGAFRDLVGGSPAAMQQFLDYVTINVTEFFRDSDRFLTAFTYALPHLLRRNPHPFVWSAGCANGAEAYSAGVLLLQEAPSARGRIWATDIDRRSLAGAREGLFTAAEVAPVPAHLRDRYFTRQDAQYRVDARLRAMIEFQHHDLLGDPYPPAVDFILCRNVVIYFSPEAKRAVFTRFFHALRPGGCLFVGNTERIMEAEAIGFTSPQAHLYRKPG